MDKITSYMRVTKKRRALQDEDAAVAAKGKAKCTSTTAAASSTSGRRAKATETPVTEAEDPEFVPEFIFKVASEPMARTVDEESRR